MGFAPQFMEGINNPQLGAVANDPDVAYGGQDQIYNGLPVQMPGQITGQMPGQFPYGMNRPIGIGMPYYQGEQQQPMIMPNNPIQTTQPSLFAQPAPTPMMQQPNIQPMPTPVMKQPVMQPPQAPRPIGIGMPMEPAQQQFTGGLRPAPRGYRPPARNLMAMRRGLMR